MTKPRSISAELKAANQRIAELEKENFSFWQRIAELESANADLVKRIAELTSAVDNEPATSCCGPEQTTSTKFLPDSPEDKLLQMFGNLSHLAAESIGCPGKKVRAREIAYGYGVLRTKIFEAYRAAKLIKEYETK